MGTSLFARYRAGLGPGDVGRRVLTAMAGTECRWWSGIPFGAVSTTSISFFWEQRPHRSQVQVLPYYPGTDKQDLQRTSRYGRNKQPLLTYTAQDTIPISQRSSYANHLDSLEAHPRAANQYGQRVNWQQEYPGGTEWELRFLQVVQSLEACRGAPREWH